jgi:hypothetical protein
MQGEDFTVAVGEAGQQTLIIDFATGEGHPAELLRDPITEVPRWYTKLFWDQVSFSGSDRALVQSASLTLKYELERTQREPRGISQSPYVCVVSIFDIRGKNYRAHFEGWWHVERAFHRTSQRWWNRVTWFRRGKEPIW